MPLASTRTSIIRSFPSEKGMESSIPFAEGKDLIIDVPVYERGTADVYIDNTISLTVDVEDSNNVQRLEQATLMAINCASQEKHNDDPIPI